MPAGLAGAQPGRQASGPRAAVDSEELSLVNGRISDTEALDRSQEGRTFVPPGATHLRHSQLTSTEASVYPSGPFKTYRLTPVPSVARRIRGGVRAGAIRRSGRRPAPRDSHLPWEA